METFVYVRDPEAVLAGFYRVLRPGGRIALIEYDHEEELGHLAKKAGEVNRLAAMPTNQRSKPGIFEDILREAGFENVEVRNFSENIRPMLQLFYCMALIPYLFIALFGLQKYFINTVAGAHGLLGQDYWSFVAVTATKPGGRSRDTKIK